MLGVYVLMVAVPEGRRSEGAGRRVGGHVPGLFTRRSGFDGRADGGVRRTAGTQQLWFAVGVAAGVGLSEGGGVV
ncbi:hypothetical protein GCM10029976_073440 [Kribbella albertanoniae]